MYVQSMKDRNAFWSQDGCKRKEETGGKLWDGSNIILDDGEGDGTGEGRSNR